MGRGDDPLLSMHVASNKSSTQVAGFVILSTASSSKIRYTVGSHGWLVKTYLWALAIIFAYVLLLACVFDLVGMGWGLQIRVSITFHWLSTVFCRCLG